jgi:ArsR family transcriptional regulator, arsenate/arsenite/antimonite-responsive transcriptional repressor
MAVKKGFNFERFFQALGDNTRLRLLNLMGDQEICVCYFVEVLKQSQPKISRHLAYLRNAGLVEARRNGTWMHYRIVTPPDEGAARILADLLGHFRQDKAMQAERAKLTKACCAPQKLADAQQTRLPSPLEAAVVWESR